MKIFLARVWPAAYLTASALLGGAPAIAEPLQHNVVEPRIEGIPTADNMAHLYPERAERLEIQGTASIHCDVRVNHTLENCTVESETPGGLGFGEAALKLSAYFKVSPRLIDGAPQAGGVFRTRISFKLEGSSNAPVGQGAYFMQNVQWVKKPTQAQVDAAYPAGANGAGHMQLLCKITGGGDLEQCIAWHEEPIGKGFGPAGLSLAPLFKAALPRSIQAGDGFIVTPINFVQPKEASAHK